MARWICGYSLVVIPILLLISLGSYLTSDLYLARESQYYGFEVLTEVIGSAGQIVAALLLFLGGLGLETRRGQRFCFCVGVLPWVSIMLFYEQ
jgi:hypothetical protein